MYPWLAEELTIEPRPGYVPTDIFLEKPYYDKAREVWLRGIERLTTTISRKNNEELCRLLDQPQGRLGYFDFTCHYVPRGDTAVRFYFSKARISVIYTSDTEQRIKIVRDVGIPEE